MQQGILIDIPLVWEQVRTVRQRVAEALAAQPEELRLNAIMVASELAENAVKYGAAVPGLESAHFSLQLTSTELRIQVANGVTSSRQAERVGNMLSQMSTQEHGKERYVSRLLELARNPMQSTRLGLYRISYEGNFQLEYSYANKVLTLTARRSLP